MNIWKFPYYINKPSLVQIRLQLFKWGHFHIFSLSYNLTSDDLWPWYMTYDLINKFGSPCCIYDPNLVEIHQSMWKIEPNVNPFFTTDNNNNRQQWTKWSLRVFPAKAGDTKTIPKAVQVPGTTLHSKTRSFHLQNEPHITTSHCCDSLVYLTYSFLTQNHCLH